MKREGYPNDLQDKLDEYKRYYNNERGHCGINGDSPSKTAGEETSDVISFDHFKWKKTLSRIISATGSSVDNNSRHTS